MTSQQRHLVLMQGGGHLRAEPTNRKSITNWQIYKCIQILTVRIDDVEFKRSVQALSVPQSFPSTSWHCMLHNSQCLSNSFRQVTGSWMCSLAARCFRQDAHVDVNSIGSSKDLARHKEYAQKKAHKRTMIMKIILNTS